jgi:drug/metabolite transporter (DMT)-like permease
LHSGERAIYRPGTQHAPLHLLVLAVSFAMVGVCTGFAFEDGASPLAVVTLRALGTLAVLGVYFAFAGVTLALPRRDIAVALAIGLPLCLNSYLVNAAMAELPVPLVVLLFYLWPGITAAASWALGIEPFRWRGAAGLALAFAGIAMALNVDFTAAQTYGVWLALGAAVTWTIVFLAMGHYLRGRDTRAHTFYMSAVSAAVFVAAWAVAGGASLPQSAPGWAGVAGIVLFFAFAMIGIFAASARYGAIRSAFWLNFEPLASVLLAALILGQTLAPIQLAGAALVVAALFLFRPPPAAPT